MKKVNLRHGHNFEMGLSSYPHSSKEDGKKILVFSMGNSKEDHGPALPLDIDDKVAQYVSIMISHMRSAKYCGHIPYCTDRVGRIAASWSPGYIPIGEIIVKIKEFIKYHLRCIKGVYAEKIIIITGHFGNTIIKEYLSKLNEGLEGNKIDLFPAFYVLSEQYSDFSKFGSVVPGHADTFEHSVASVLKLVDYNKLRMMNYLIRENMEESLRRWPAIGGLAGYIYFGGKKFRILKEPQYGLLRCVEQFKKDRKIRVIPQLGKMIIKYSIKNLQNIILQKL